MGLTLAAAEFLAEAAAGGVSFDRTLTVGRQYLLAGPDRLWPVLKKHGIQPSRSRAAFRRELGWQPWGEPLFKLLGASEVEALDASGYQGASIIQDLNEPIPGALHERFDVVVDCGTLEHVFNVPVALKSYMDMVRLGGHLILVLPANNQFGHGFYQFSAELLYSALSEQNGYAIERMLISQDDFETVHRFGGRSQVSLAYGPRYEIADPRVVRQRVVLRGNPPSSLLVQAKRTARRTVFEAPPQQSDYVREWDTRDAWARTAPAGTARSRLRRAQRLRRHVVQPVLLWLHWDGIPRLLPLLDPLARWRNRREQSLRNRRLFRRVD